MPALRSWLAGSGLGLVLLCAGGFLFETAAHNVNFELKTALESCLEEGHNKRWAEAAWHEVCQANGWNPQRVDYGNGFKEGFAAHLYRGATEPPALPPLHYR